MQLELEIDPDAVADVIGLRPLATSRDGRSRSQAVKIVWYDSPDHTLLSQGLTVSEQRGIWRLERVLPSQETWLPGQPPPVLKEAEDRNLLSTDMPATLTPVAAFEGRRTLSTHRFAIPPALPPHATGRHADTALVTASQAAAVTLTVERGVLRSVTAEQPVARLTLSGEDHAVHAAALMIAGAVSVSVPRASLAAHAFARAIGGVPAPRRLGAPVLPNADMALADALAHILGHLTDVVLHYAPVAARPEAKHHRSSGPNGNGVAEKGSGGNGAGSKSLRQHGPGETELVEQGLAADASDARRTEAVHQMRVAVRRALSAMSIFRDALPEGTLDPLRDGLKVLGARLGQTRDWDVFISETAPMVTQPLMADERLDRLIAAATRRQRECRNALADYLTSPPFRSLAIDLAWFAAASFWRANAHLSLGAHSTADPAPGDQSTEVPDQRPDSEVTKPGEPLFVRDFAPGVLQNRWKKLASAGKRIEELNVPSLHDVRLRAKRARYCAEMFAVLYQGKSVHRFIRRLSVLQQQLGVLNDGAVAAQLLQQLGGPSNRHAYAVGVVIGFNAARAQKIRPRIVRAFDKFRRQPSYWT